MPNLPWAGYGRFCPLARALDVVGDRWTLVIIQELLKRPCRYSELTRRLPGISTTVVAERLRKLESAGVVERRAGGVGEGVMYATTERGLALETAFEALRRWGVEFLVDPTADGAEHHTFDVHYVDGIDALDDAVFGLVVDGTPTTLRFTNGYLEQTAGESSDATLVVKTTAMFMDRWAAGELTWDQGVAAREVVLSGAVDAWNRWLAATGYLLRYDAEPADADRAVSRREDLFWKLADTLLAQPEVTRSTMMGYPCLRVNGRFFACVERSTGNLVVKLPADRVNNLVSSGLGISFAPNGRVFREWIAVPIPDEDEWTALLDEARTFVVG